MAQSPSFQQEVTMLTREQREEFEARGIIVVPKLLSEDTVRSLKQAIDCLQEDTPYSNTGRWNLRHCLPLHPCFVDLLVNEMLLAMMVDRKSTRLNSSHRT